MTTQPDVIEQDNSTQPRFQLSLRTVSLILVAVGLLVSGYLSYSTLTNTATVCIDNGSFSCEVVQRSVYSKLAGIPIAYLGFGIYVVLAVLLLLENRVPFLREYGITLIFGITLFSFMFSMWLVYVQAALLQAFCQWCLTHEITMTLLFIVSGIRLKRHLSS